MNFKYTDFTPVDDRILVQPGPVRKIEVTHTVPDTSKPVKPIKKGEEPILPTKAETFMARTSMRVGQILKLSVNSAENLPYKEGDWIVYPESKAAIPFDLLATRDNDEHCPVLLRRYDVVSVVTEDGIKQIDQFNNNNNEESKESSI